MSEIYKFITLALYSRIEIRYISGIKKEPLGSFFK